MMVPTAYPTKRRPITTTPPELVTRQTRNQGEVSPEEHSRIATWAAPAISAPPSTPHAHPNAIALRRPILSLVMPTEALPNHASHRSLSAPSYREHETNLVMSRVSCDLGG